MCVVIFACLSVVVVVCSYIIIVACLCLVIFTCLCVVTIAFPYFIKFDGLSIVLCMYVRTCLNTNCHYCLTLN